MDQVLKDDVLFDLVNWSGVIVHYRPTKYITLFYLMFVLSECVVGVVTVMLTWNIDYFIKYCCLIPIVLLGLACYVSLLGKHDVYHEMYHELFPQLWPLDAGGQEHFQQFKKIAKRTKLLFLASVIVCVSTATAALPWNFDPHEVYVPVKIFDDYLGKWSLPFVILFYMNFYHFGLSVVSTCFCLLYLVLHLYIQCFLINNRLEKLMHYMDNMDFDDDEKNGVQQVFIMQELIACVQHHQKLQDFANRINDMIYYPIFLVTAGGITFSFTLLLLPRLISGALLPSMVGSIAAFWITVLLGSVGQLLEDESEKIFYSVYNLPWYYGNSKNKKIVQMLLLNTQKQFTLSSSNIITINNGLLITLYKGVSSCVFFYRKIST